MRKYTDYYSTENPTWSKYKIIVSNEEDKEELMEAFKHFHDADINPDYITVNQLIHEYLFGYNIVVNEILFNELNSPKKGNNDSLNTCKI